MSVTTNSDRTSSCVLGVPVSILVLIKRLKEKNYCLMTDENNVEMHDENGGLMVCTPDQTSVMNVPNCEEIRNLYDLPKIIPKQENGSNVNKTSVTNVPKSEEIRNLYDLAKTNPKKVNASCVKNGEQLNLPAVCYVDIIKTKTITNEEPENQKVWTFNRTPKCADAAVALAKLVSSDKYRAVLEDKNTYKIKVWESIAEDLHKQGYLIDENIKDAGAKAFQKHRNMERTYWRFLKEPTPCGKINYKERPAYFDILHCALSKTSRYEKQLKSLGEPDGIDMYLNANVAEEVVAETEDGDLGSGSDEPGPELANASNDLPPETIEEFLKLMGSGTYQESFAGTSRKIRVWEKIHDDLVSAGYVVPSVSRRDGIEKIFRKWMCLKNAFLRYQVNKGQTNIYKKPEFYDMMVEIVSKDFKKDSATGNPVPTSAPVSEDGSSVPDRSETTQLLDHDYDFVPTRVEDVEMEVDDTNAQSTANVDEVYDNSVPVTAPSTDHSLQKSDEILQQLTVLNGTASNIQQSFAKIISLLEEQVSNQRTLNSLFTQYVTSQEQKNGAKRRISS